MNLAQSIIVEARTWLGTKYHHQGRLKKNANYLGGVDCFGLLIVVAKELRLTSKDGGLFCEYDVTDYSAYHDGVRLKSILDKHLIRIKKDEIKPGDMLLIKFFGQPQHVGIVSDFSDGKLGIIHCYSSSGQVVEHILSPKWQRMLMTVYRFKDNN